MERYRISGRVQGVGFRYWTVRTAQRFGIRGTVRNQADGLVEVVAAGDAAALAGFRDALHSGPPGAEVTEVRVMDHAQEQDVTGEGFTIIR